MVPSSGMADDREGSDRFSKAAGTLVGNGGSPRDGPVARCQDFSSPKAAKAGTCRENVTGAPDCRRSPARPFPRSTRETNHAHSGCNGDTGVLRSGGAGWQRSASRCAVRLSLRLAPGLRRKGWRQPYLRQCVYCSKARFRGAVDTRLWRHIRPPAFTGDGDCGFAERRPVALAAGLVSLFAVAKLLISGGERTSSLRSGGESSWQWQHDSLHVWGRWR